MAKRPVVRIVFKQKASTLIERSGESVCVLLLKKGSTANELYKKIDLISDITTDELEGKTADSAKAYKAINYCMANSPKRVIISNLGWVATKNRLLKEGITNFVVTDIEADADSEAMVSDVISLAENKGFGCYAVAIDNVPSRHSTHYIAVAGDTRVKYFDVDDAELSEYVVKALYTGAIAACGVKRSITNYTLPLVARVEVSEADDEDLTEKGIIYAELSSGKIRVVAGVNTAEVSGNVTEDMQHIETVMTMDMMCKDIGDTFCEYYRGAYKNNYTNQLLLIAAINGYFAELADEEILDPEYDNKCEIDIEAQRQAWLDYGKSEAADWSADIVKFRSFGRKVFLKGNVKICQSMEDLDMYIELE